MSIDNMIHDGDLDEGGNRTVTIHTTDSNLSFVKLYSAISRSSFHLSAEEALSLLKWLEQERSTLEQLSALVPIVRKEDKTLITYVTLYLRNRPPQERAKLLNEATHEYVMKLKPEKCGATSGDVITSMPIPFEHDETYFCTQMHCNMCGWNGVYSGRFQDLPIDMPWQHTRPLPDYSRDMRAAWSIRDAFKTRYPLLDLYIHACAYNRVYAQFSLERDETLWSEANGEYAGPEAIVLAALKVENVEVKE